MKVHTIQGILLAARSDRTARRESKFVVFGGRKTPVAIDIIMGMKADISLATCKE